MIFKLIKFKIILLGFMGLSLYRFIKTYKNIQLEGFLNKIKEVWKNIDKTKALLVFVMFLLTMRSMRFITYFIFVIIPFCYDDFYAIFSKQLKPLHNKIKEIIIFSLMVAAFLLNVIARDFKYSNFHNIFPLTEIEYLIENDVRGNVFVPFEIGSYSAYKLYPYNFILHDGRYEEVYDPKINDFYAKIISLGAVGWKDVFNSMHHDAVITYKNYAFYENLKQHPDYYLIMESDTFALFLRKEVYHRIKPPVRVPTDKPEFYQKTLWNNNINWKKP